MTQASTKILITAVSLILVQIIAGGVRAQSVAMEPAPQKAEEVFENIQVLKGVPAEQVIPTMHFFSASLGVDCNFCHENEYAKDGNPEKLATRKMVQMTRAINNTTFDGRLAVTCY